jgi:hypothetical protein
MLERTLISAVKHMASPRSTAWGIVGLKGGDRLTASLLGHDGNALMDS